MAAVGEEWEDERLRPRAEPVDPEWTAPVLESRRVALGRVRRDDYGFVIGLETDPANGFRWRHGARTPTDDEIVGSLGRGVHAQFLVWRRDPALRIGLVNLYNADPVNQHAYLGILSTPDVVRQGLALEAALLMLRYGFAHFAFRKIYAEVNAGNLGQFSSGIGRLLHEEGRLRDHLFYNDRYWDLVTLAVYREEFYAQRDRYDRFLGIDGGGGAPDGAPRRLRRR